MRTTRLVVLHPHRIVAEAIARRLDAEPDLRVVEMCANPASVQSAANALAPDVAVVHVEPQDRAVFELIAALADRDPAVASVAILATDDTQAAIHAIRAGASSVLSKDSATSELVEAVISVVQNEAFVSAHLLHAVLRELRSSEPMPNEYDMLLRRLTPREREVLSYLASGHDRATIAARMRLSVDTVRTHTRNILAKLEVHSSLEAVSIARRASARGWSQPSKAEAR